jgi:SanA protein
MRRHAGRSGCLAFFRRRWPWLILSLCCLPAVLFSLVLALRWTVDRRYRTRIHDVEDVPPRTVAIVFGAGITADGRPLPALADRVVTAARLYKAGKVRKLLMSGDNRFVYYDEPGAMRRYALAQGVPDEDIVLDYAGRRTYDTCYRAGYIFGVEDAILVTQHFHLDRALYTCDKLGIDVVGVSADQRTYSLIRYWWWRELAAVTRAWLDLNFLHPTPVLGEKLPIS